MKCPQCGKELEDYEWDDVSDYDIGWEEVCITCSKCGYYDVVTKEAIIFKGGKEMSYKLKAEELAGALDAFADFHPKADVKIMVGDKVYYVTSSVGFNGNSVLLVADVDGNAK